MRKIIKTGLITASLFLAVPVTVLTDVHAAEGPETPTFYDGYFSYKIVTEDGGLISEWSDPSDYESLQKYSQPEFAEVAEEEEIPVYCIENRYYGLDSNVVIPESSNSGCGFAALDDSTNIDYYTADSSDWNGYYASIEAYVGPQISNLEIPEYLNDGTKVIGFSIVSNYSNDTSDDAVRVLTIPDSVKNVYLMDGTFPSLEEIRVSDKNSSLKVVDNVLYTGDLYRMILVPANRKGETLSVPEGVVSVSSLNGNKNLKEVSLPSTVQDLASDFLSGTAVEKVTVADGSDILYSKDGIVYLETWTDHPQLIFYPQDKTDPAFTAGENVEVQTGAFTRNEYLEELTLGKINFNGDGFGDLPKLKTINYTRTVDEAEFSYNPYFSYEGALYYSSVSSAENFEELSIEEKLKEYGHLAYYPQGKTDEFFEAPPGLNSLSSSKLNDYVKAIYLHKGCSLDVSSTSNIEYVYYEESSAYGPGGNIHCEYGVTPDEARAHYEEAKNNPEPEVTEEPAATEEPEATETPEPAPVQPSGNSDSGTGGFIAIGAVAVIVAAAGAAIVISKKKKSSAQ